MSKKIKVRPGKTQSKAGFVIGIIFCLIGLVVIVPTFGLFGLLWTGAAGWITYSNYRNGFTDRPINNQVIEIEEHDRDGYLSGRQEEKSHDDSDHDTEDRLRKLQSLYQQGLITQDEYETKRAQILDEL